MSLYWVFRTILTLWWLFCLYGTGYMVLSDNDQRWFRNLTLVHTLTNLPSIILHIRIKVQIDYDGTKFIITGHSEWLDCSVLYSLYMSTVALIWDLVILGKHLPEGDFLLAYLGLHIFYCIFSVLCWVGSDYGRFATKGVSEIDSTTMLKSSTKRAVRQLYFLMLDRGHLFTEPAKAKLQELKAIQRNAQVNHPVVTNSEPGAPNFYQLEGVVTMAVAGECDHGDNHGGHDGGGHDGGHDGGDCGGGDD